MIEEPKLKKKNVLNKILHNQLIVTCITVFMVVFILIGASYAILTDGEKEIIETNNVNIQVGNMQAVLSSKSKPFSFEGANQKPIPDSVGIIQEPYSFSLSNTGGKDIAYYEIRMVDQENKQSTLAHKYVRFSIQKDDNDYKEPSNLGDVNSILYSGTNLLKGETVNFNLKMWIDEKASSKALNKELYGAIEVTLYENYNEYDYYVLYDVNGGTNIPVKTSLLEPITNETPVREGYTFIGWSETINGDIKYYNGDNYTNEKGITLYAVWER